MNIAAIDCGTNSIRLLVAGAHLEGETVSLQDLSRQMRIVRLGEGVDETGALSQAAIDRTLSAVEEYRQIMRDFDVQDMEFVATSAMRDASNGGELTAKVEEILGVAPQIVPGTKEAELSFVGAVDSLGDIPKPALVVDIGGGSTEFVFGDTKVQASKSIDMGSVRLTERFGLNRLVEGSSDQEEAFMRARDWVRRQLEEKLAGIIPLVDLSSLVGVAGTVTTLGAYTLGVTKYNPNKTHGQFLSWQQWNSAADFMIHTPVAQKAKLGFMPQGRADVIAAGAIIWQEIIAWIRRGTSLQGAYLSEHDILDGIAFLVARRSLLQ